MHKSLAALLGLALSIATVPAFAAYDAFLKMDGIAGESTNASHASWIDVISFSSNENPLTIGSASSGAGAGKITFNPFTITRKIDKASPAIFQAAANGTHIAHVTLEFTNDGSHAVVWRALLTDAIVTSARKLPVRGDAAPTEQIVVAAKSYEIWSRPANADGTFGVWVKRDINEAKAQLPKIFVRPAPATAPPVVQP